MSQRPSVLILLGAYWPGHESTGPNLSVRAMCDALSDRFDFRIVARDRPFTGGPALGISGSWHQMGYAALRYMSVSRVGAKGLFPLLNETPHDLVVLNGFFDREFTLPFLVGRRLKRVPNRPALLSPRGELTGGALSLKSGRKAFFRRWAERLQLHRGIHFHATSELELIDIRAALPSNRCSLAPNFRGLFPLPVATPRRPGTPLRLAFVGRVTPVKRLDFALRALAKAGVPAHLDIFGPKSDSRYWQTCSAQIATLPAGMVASYRGEMPNAEVPIALASHDALLLPSMSENFGHAIFESLAAGTPVIIGDRTPWRGLQAKRAGFDLPVADLDAFAAAIRQMAGLSDTERLAWRQGARAYVAARADQDNPREVMAELFSRLIAESPRA